MRVPVPGPSYTPSHTRRASPLIAFKSCRMIGRGGASQAEETRVCFAIYLLSIRLRIAYEEELLVYADYSCCCQPFIFRTAKKGLRAWQPGEGRRESA